MVRFDNKIAMVTGAARGIGRAIALRFAREGANLVLLDVLDEALADTERAALDYGRQAICIQADVTSQAEIKKALDRALNHYGRIDIVVNNAGVGGSKGCLETSESDWDTMVDANLKSVFLVCKMVIPEMIKNGGGKIINIASMYGILGSPNAPSYCASKAGVINLTRQLAIDFARHNILVNSISPGLIETDMTRKKLSDPQKKDQFVGAIPLKRPGKPENIASAALFLASEDAEFVNGHNLVVDGGQSCQVL